MSVFPVFVLQRHREIENQDLILAGRLWLNTFGRRRPTRRQRIIRGLTNDAQASRMSPAEARHRVAMARRAFSPSMIRGM